MSEIIDQIQAQKSLFTNGRTQRHFHNANFSDRDAFAADDHSLHGEIKSSVSEFANFLAAAYQVERFRDFVYMAFDDMDYSMIRDYLSLPKKRITVSDDLNCGCRAHREKLAARPRDKVTPNFWRTWDKMVHCAEKLNWNRNASEILTHLNETSRFLNCQRMLL